MKLILHSLLAALPLAAIWPALDAAADPLDADIIIIRQVDPRSAIRAEAHPGEKPYAGAVTSQVNASPAHPVLNATGDLDDALLGATRASPGSGGMLYNAPQQSYSNLSSSSMPSPAASGAGGHGAGIAGAIQQGMSPLNHLPGM